MLVAEGIRAAGRRVACVGLYGQHDPALPQLCDRFGRAGVIRLGRWIRLLRRWDVEQVMMVGKVRKARMYQPFLMLRQMPDLRAAYIWYRVLRHDRRSAVLLAAVADVLHRGSITVIDSTRYISEHLSEAGVMTRHHPTASQEADIEFALPIIRQLNDLDIGQSIAVKDREVIAVEAMEGTDQMIERAGDLCRVGGWTLIKTAKCDQDMRFDVPTVGPATIEQLKHHRATTLAVEVGRVILLDKPQFLAAADQAGIAVVGVRIGEERMATES